ncbi:MAG: spore coat protein U domain-containing protein [Candidatus Dasytiphilus stammeri]
MMLKEKLVVTMIVFFFSKITLANCMLANGEVNLGIQSSFDILNGNIKNKGSSGLACSGLSLTVLTHHIVQAQINSTRNNMKMINIDGSGDYIPYIIYADKEFQYAYQVGQLIDYGQLNLISIIFSSKKSQVPLYIKIIPRTANVRAGVYQDIINLHWKYHICNLGSLFFCLSAWDGHGSTSIKVQVIVNKDCMINDYQNVDFGSHALIDQFQTLTQRMTLRCTKQEHYKVWFNEGLHATDRWRRMSDGKQHYIMYNIYHPDTNIIWNYKNKKELVGTGKHQSLRYKTSVNKKQTELHSGNYSDTISIVVEY